MESTNTRERILDAALDLADSRSWEEITLGDVASDTGIPPGEIYRHYSQKDDLAEAWFDRADQAMLQISPADLSGLPVTQRLHHIIFTWLDALAGHRKTTRQMLKYKLEPLHFHLQAGGITRVSRTVQWFIDLAGLDARNLERISVEIALTSIYLSTFTSWLFDDSENQTRSRKSLQHKLELADSLHSTLTGSCSGSKPNARPSGV